jgi:NaMN:DMB phosphoribosyltransferase
MSWLHDELRLLRAPHDPSGDAVRERAADILRPAGALATLDELAAWVAEWHGSPRPDRCSGQRR